MARKLPETTSDSSLSPPPDDLITSIPADGKPAANGKKRKANSAPKASGPKRARKKKDEDENERIAPSTVATGPKKARKKTGEDVAPLAERTAGSKLRVGAHVSTAGGVNNAIPNLLHIGANAFALFLKNQRTWNTPPLDPALATLFVDGCKHHDILAQDCCVPHGSYLVNLAHPDEDRKKQAYSSFKDDLVRCHKLGIKYYNFHPGNANATTREGGIKLIAEAINKAHSDPDTGDVIPLLETMATVGNTIGGQFNDISEVIELVENKARVGVCLDTCHVFAAGYDLRTPEAYAETMDQFDQIIGVKYLKALHVNDSKAPLGSHRDLHARIGTGYLGLRSFHNIVNDERLHGLPMILETPIDTKDENGKKIEDKNIWAREIKMLEQLVDMNVDGEQFKKLEADLFEEGVGERERVGDQVKRKQAKDATPKKKRGKKVKSVDEED